MAMDKLTIDTPEQVHLEFVLAGIGSRFMAVLADSAILFFLYLLLFLLEVLILKGTVSRFAAYQTWMLGVVVFLLFCVYWGYYAAFEALWKGQTPGKRWAGIRVIKESGRSINAWEAIGRNLMRVIDQFPGIYAVGIVTMLLNSKHRRLGDFVAGTLVVHEKGGKESELFFNTPAKSEFPFPQAANLSIQEVELIENFLARRLDVPAEVRRFHASRIAQMIGTRLGIVLAARPQDNEDFLELIAREFRNRARY